MPEIHKINKDILAQELLAEDTKAHLASLNEKRAVGKDALEGGGWLSHDKMIELQLEQQTLTTEIDNLNVNIAAIDQELDKLRALRFGELMNEPFFKQIQNDVNVLKDEYPLLLFPMRVETRFVNPELWIRIYPDTCQIEIDRNYLTEEEWKSIRKYAGAYIKSLDIAEKSEKSEIQKNAFIELVHNHGAGRAAFIYELYTKRNEGTLNSPNPDKRQLIPPEMPNEGKYFENITEIVKATRGPHVTTLPERLIFLLYDRNGLAKTAISEKIPSPLPAGFDLSTRLNEDKNKGIEWLHDFNKAIEVGLGIKIPLEAEEYNKGFEKLLVLGINTQKPELEGKSMLEDLLKNHLYSRDGVSVIRQGTATNNNDDSNSGYSSREDAIEAYEITVNGKNRFSANANSELTSADFTDGLWLSQYLGIEDTFFTKVENGAGSDQMDARAMNVALSPATIGYYLEEMLSPLVNRSEREGVETFLANYVFGRGTIPALRIGKQPYGILPVSVLSRLNLKEEDDVRKKIVQVVQNLFPIWRDKSKHVKRVTKNISLTRSDFVDILSLQPNSCIFSSARNNFINNGAFTGSS